MASTIQILFVLLSVSTVRGGDVINHAEESAENYAHGPDESLINEVPYVHEKRILPELPLLGNGGIGGKLIDPLAASGVYGNLLGQLVEVTNNVAIPVIHYRGIPIPVPHPVPVPIHVPVKVPHPVPITVYKNVPVPVDKPIIVPKPFPVKVIKEVPVPKPVPVPVPVYKTKHIHHIAFPKHNNDWW